MYTAWRTAEASREKAKVNLDNARHQQALRRHNAARKHLFKRLYFDGLEDLHKAGSRRQKIFWILFIVACYSMGTFMWIRKLDEYRIGKTAILVETQLPIDYRYFPRITLCHMSGWNKTYMEENVEITNEILAAALQLGYDRSELIYQFSDYLQFSTDIDTTDLDLDPPLWDLLTKIFELNFRDAQLSDFIVDVAFRPNELFRRCSFAGVEYPCMAVPVPILIPACYVVPSYPKREYNDLTYYGLSNTKIPIANPTMDVSLSLTKRHVFSDRTSAGVKIFLGNRGFTPFSNQHLQTPANTHAIIVYQPVRQDSRTKCYPDEMMPKLATVSYNDDACLVEKVQNMSKEICGCRMIAGPYQPPNGEVCTPKLVKECVQERVLATVNGTDLFDNGMDCKPMCDGWNVYATMTYYNLEGPNDDEYIANRLTILHDPQRQIHESEIFLADPYMVLCDIGGLIGVYTGLSFAAGVQSAVLITVSLLLYMNMTLLKPLIALHVDIPLAGTLPPRWVVAKVQAQGTHSNQHPSVAQGTIPDVSIRIDRPIQVRRNICVQSV